jgi:lipoyl(octanoyl) transferase
MKGKIPKVRFESFSNKKYEEIWEYQTVCQQSLVSKKREWQSIPVSERPGQEHKLIFCEHNHVYTLGKSGDEKHLIIGDQQLNSKGIEFFKINRGGDITYHGPGQITGYPVFDLDEFSTDVHLYVRNLEEVVIRTLKEYGLKGQRITGYTGVWLADDDQNEQKRKICAIGVHLSRWVTMHGFAFNINTDLRYFDFIIPCGIADKNKTVTSLAKELGREIPLEEVMEKLKFHFKTTFGFEFVV